MLAVAWLRVPHLALLPAVAVAVVLLARVGRPADRRILATAVTKPRFRRLNPDIVLRAYYAAGLGKPDKRRPGRSGSGRRCPATAGTGSQVLIDLPYGKGFDDAVKAKGAIASGLDVSVNQVFLTRTRRRTAGTRCSWPTVTRSPSRPAGRRCWTASSATSGRRRRSAWTSGAGQVDLLLMWISLLIGAQPRKGKTFSARLLALYAALDPYVRLHGGGREELPGLAQVHAGRPPRWCSAPTRPATTTRSTQFRDLLREIMAHIDRSTTSCPSCRSTQCPEGKLTRELARDRRYPDLRVWVLVMEEFQVYFETDDQDVNKEIAPSCCRSSWPSARPPA